MTAADPTLSRTWPRRWTRWPGIRRRGASWPRRSGPTRTRWPGARAHGRPAGQELIARGSSTLCEPRCVVCGRTGRGLTVTRARGRVHPVRARRNTAACAVRGRQARRRAQRRRLPICERCRRHQRGQRGAGYAARPPRSPGAPTAISPTSATAASAARGHLHGCGRRRPCSFATSDRPICKRARRGPRAACARCGQDRPPAAGLGAGLRPCYTAALRHRGRCASCQTQRRLVTPPGPDATTCADCAGLAVTHACIDCGLEDKLYETGRCARCACAAAPASAARRPRRSRPSWSRSTTRSARPPPRAPH